MPGLARQGNIHVSGDFKAAWFKGMALDWRPNRHYAVREEFVPVIRKAKGFVRYYWLDTGNGEGASVSVFKDKAGADKSITSRRGLRAEERFEVNEAKT